MKKIIVVENENIKLKINQVYNTELDIFVLNNNNQKELLKTILHNKANAGIFVDSNYNVDLVHQKLGGWKTVNNFTLDMIVLEKMDIKPEYPKILSKKIPFGKTTSEITFNKKGIEYGEEHIFEALVEKISILEKDDFYGVINDFNTKWGYFYIEQKIIESKKAVAYNRIRKEIMEGKTLPGLKKATNVNGENNSLTFNMDISAIEIKENENSYELMILTNSLEEVNSHYQHRGLPNNLVNHICNNETDGVRKIKKKELIISIIGLIVFIVLTVLTFTKILDPNDVAISFKIIFSPDTLSHVWIYLLWFNFVISFFFSFIMMFLISYAVQRKRPNLQTMLTYFVASQIRATARFITGEAIIGTILWGWYIVKKNKIRTSSLVGAVASLAIIRGVFTFIIGIIFMTIGQVYLNDVFNYANSFNSNDWNVALFYVLSWGGLVWILIDRFVRSSIVYLPPMHYLYNRIYTRIILFKKNPNVLTNMENREMSLISLKSSTKNILLNKERIYRISLMTIFAIFLEALELMYIFNIVEMYNAANMPSYDLVMHYNFLEISGGRYMITMIRNFPLINVAPGGGIGFIEYFMSNSFDAMYLYSHNSTNLELAHSFANQTTFITRLFNTYFKMILSSMITGYVLTKILLRRRS